TASAGVALKYHWYPEGEHAARLERLFGAAKRYVYGVVALCRVSDFAENQRQGLEWAQPWGNSAERRAWVSSFPFSALRSGDFIGIDTSSCESPVWFLDHDGEGGSHLLADSFDQFLARMNELCYIEPWFWELFVDPTTPTSTERSKVQLLRDLFQTGDRS